MEGELHAIGQHFLTEVSAGETRIDGAYDKVLWRLHDERFPLRMLPPYQGATAAAADAFGRFLRARYPLWAPY